MSAFEVKRTCLFALQMSANDPKRTFDGDAVFSVLKPWRAAGAELIVDRKVPFRLTSKLARK